VKRIVVTGGPGAGKTASLETARRILCGHVGFAPESASIVFGGGFPRESSPHSERAVQRAIYHVQRELEALFDGHSELGVLVCDRGTIDCSAYWPGDEAEFYRQLGTSREGELARYAFVIHLRPPVDADDGYERSDLRIETAAEAHQIDARIERAWRGHPRRIFVEHTHDFVAKVSRVVGILEAELSCGEHPRRVA
jgi:predicted ATPase